MEVYAIGRRRKLCVILVFCAIILRSVLSAPTKYSSDECDWFGSGLDTQNRKFGIQPVYLRCKEGIVDWRYPRGALRIILRLGQSNKDFQGCLKIMPSSSGATLYQEEPQRLKYLYGSAEDPETKDEQICFKSNGGQVALFLEANGIRSTLKKDVFRLMYDLEPIKQKHYSECRPCTDRQLLYLFCTSDFVARGFITSLYQNEVSQQTELTIHSHEVLRDTEPKVFNKVFESTINSTYYSGTVYRPFHCGTKVGSGEFLVIGRRRLDEPILLCAPRWTYWKKLSEKAIRSENLDCMLQ